MMNFTVLRHIWQRSLNSLSIILYYAKRQHVIKTNCILHITKRTLSIVVTNYTVSQKTSPTFLAITRESIDGFLYLAETLLRKQAIICCCTFPPHLINASTLPCETKNTEIVSFHVNVA